MVRENRRSTEGKITKSLSIDPKLADEIDALAHEEGHHNFSTIVVRAIREFIERLRQEREAA